MKLTIFTGAVVLTIALMQLLNAAWAGQVKSVQETKPLTGSGIQQKPNILIWLLDDVGFAQLSSYGGLIDTPNIDRVASKGLRYSNYHTAPVCSASRAALLTGRNPHSVHMGGHAALRRPFPGYDGSIPAAAGTIAENLRQSGYATYALGKWDHFPSSEQSSSGPYHHWPLGQGFDRYYGFLHAETDNWRPLLTQDNSPIPTPNSPDYHLNTDLADQAIDMINTQNTLASPPPFFMYWATGTAHAPHHAPAEWVDRYKGKFDMGWDVAREKILEAEKAKGLVPATAELAARPEGMSAWSTLSDNERRLFARQMEVYAASISHADEEFGRILEHLENNGALDNTIVIITSDNGASAEAGYYGTFNEATFGNNHMATVEENMPFYDTWGGPETYPHYAFGWAVAGNTPFKYYKQTTHEGGTRVPFIVAWPKGISAHGEVRDHFAYVTDVAPTLLELADVPFADRIKNVTQTPFEGRSLVQSFSDTKNTVLERHQYVEVFGNKGLWSSDGWAIVTTHKTEAWELTTMSPINEPWELYNLNKDPGQVNNLADKYPKRVESLGRKFEAQANTYNVNPIGNTGEAWPFMLETMQKEFQQRRGVWKFPQPVAHLFGSSAPPISHLSYRMTAEVTLTGDDKAGPVFAYGGDLGGSGLYIKASRPVFILRSIFGEEKKIEASSPLPEGKSNLEFKVTYRPVKNSKFKDIDVTIAANGNVIAKTSVRFELPTATFGSFDIGSDQERTLTSDYPTAATFPGELSNVVFDFTDAFRNQ